MAENAVGAAKTPIETNSETPIETNSDLIAEVQAMVDNLPEAGGGTSSGGDVWKTIADYTAAESASWININKDSDGNAFSLKKVKVEIVLPNETESGLWYLYLSPDSRFFGTTSIGATGNNTVRIRCEAESDDIVTLAVKRDKSESNDIISLTRSADYIAITAVRFGNWSNLTFPAGARILVKGVRA